jgi:moderate conductance mechanosensitive channel
MDLPRFADTPELNNAWLIGLSMTLSLLVIWAALVTTSFLLAQSLRVSRIQTLESFAESFQRRARLTAALLSFAVVLAGTASLGYALWMKMDLQPQFGAMAAEVTPDMLAALGRSLGLLVLLLAGFYALERGGRRLVRRIEQSLDERVSREEQRAHAARFLTHLPPSINLLLTYFFVQAVSSALQLPSALEWLLTTGLFILLLVSGGRALVALLYFLSERVVVSWEDKSRGTQLEAYYTALRRLLPVGQKSLEAITYISVATLIIRKFQTLEPFTPFGPILIRIISIFFAASVVVQFSRVMIAKAFLSDRASEDTSHRRRNTFVSLLQSATMYVIYFCVAMMVLSDLGIDPTPILAGAGIVGLTVGLGAQAIVQDMLNGVFLLFEDQILNGDYIRVNDTEGTVEEITPRVTRIRDRYGRLHILRNGEIKNVINYSRGWTLAVVEMCIAYEADLKKVFAVLEEVCAQVPQLVPGKAIETPRVMGIEGMDESWMRVRIETRVAPGTHYDVKRVLHRLLFEAFQAHNVEIPYPKAIELSGPPFPPEPPGKG